MAGRIIRATVEQLPTLARLFDDYRVFYGCESDLVAAQQFLAERLEGEESVLFLVWDPDLEQGLGFAQLYPSFSSVAMRRIWILNDLYVAEDVRGRGWGRSLLEAARTFAQETGAGRLELATAKDNTVAKTLYESFGYRLDEQFDRYQLPLDA